MGGIPRHIFEYQLWDHRIVSDFELGELEAVSPDHSLRRTLHILLVSEKDWAQPGDRARLEYCFDNGDVWLETWNSGNSYIARFPGSCSFRLHPEEMRIDYAPEPDTADSTIAHLILDHAIPRLLSLRPGYIVLHTSAVQVGSQAIAILGKSGQGKSTLAAWLASQGFPLFTDDCLVLRWDEPTQQWLAQPSYRSVRLWPDSVDALGIKESELREFARYSTKKRTGKEVDFRLASGESPLKAFFVLPDRTDSDPVHSGPPAILPLPINEAFLALLQSVFRLDAESEQINRGEFEVLTGLTQTVPFWSLSYERNYDWLPEVQKAMIETVEAGRREPEGKLL